MSPSSSLGANRQARQPVLNGIDMQPYRRVGSHAHGFRCYRFDRRRTGCSSAEV